MKKIISRMVLITPLWLALTGYHFLLWPGAGGGVALGVLMIYAGIRAGKLPLVERTRIKSDNPDYRVTGRNWPLFVQVDPVVDNWRAVLAQEIWESIHKTNPISLFRSRSKSGQRALELMGHEVTVQVAVLLYGEGEAACRRAEAGRMKAAYPALFKGTDVELEMRKRSRDAEKWVRDNWERFA